MKAVAGAILATLMVTSGPVTAQQSSTDSGQRALRSGVGSGGGERLDHLAG